jgi:hypothetical protein
LKLIIYFLLDAVISGTILWVASKITGEKLHLKEAAIVSGGAAVVGVVPIIGWVASMIVFFYLLKQFTQANIWPNLILLVFVSKLVALGVIFVLLNAI